MAQNDWCYFFILYNNNTNLRTTKTDYLIAFRGILDDHTTNAESTFSIRRFTWRKCNLKRYHTRENPVHSFITHILKFF